MSKRGRENDADYLNKTIFPLLFTALKETLGEADRQNALEVPSPIQKCRFNGLDYLAEILWNRNPKRSQPARWLDAFDIPSFKVHARSRPFYPKSWLWSDEEAALRIQRYVRGWLVRKREDVQEMRRFWKVYKEE